MPRDAAAQVMQALGSWRDAGTIRRLDAAFAGFVREQQADAPAALLLASALLAHMEGRGHSCLALDELLADAEGLLGWKPPQAQALRELLQGCLPASLAEWLSALQASPLVFVDAPGAEGSTQAGQGEPLVLRGSKLYLRRYWAYEQRVAAQLLARATVGPRADTTQVRQWLDRMFPSAGESAPLDWQKLACGVAVAGRLSVITGGPGTGKTYTAARLLALLFAIDPDAQRLRVGLAAPTGKAAARLKQSIESALSQLQGQLGVSLDLQKLAGQMGAARTLHALLGARPDTRKLRADAAHPLPLDVLIVDEASMIHLEMMAALLDAMPPGGRLILLGDKDQLASVEAGAVLGDLCRDAELGRYLPRTAAYAAAVTGQTLPNEFLLPAGEGASPLAQQTVMLRESRRFGGPIGQLALAVNRGDARQAQQLLSEGQDQVLLNVQAASAEAAVRLALQGRPGAEGGYRSYLKLLAQRPGTAEAFASWVLAVLTAFERFRLLCAVREGDWGTEGLNLAVERALIADGLLSKRGEWYEGRPVMVTRNDAGLGVFNGDIGIVLRPQGQDEAAGGSNRLRAYFSDGQSLRSVAVSRLADVETAFALTVHKSQGSEFEHTVLVLPAEGGGGLTRELVYTGITRARKAFTLVSGRAPAFAMALAQRTRRASGLLELLAEAPGGESADNPAQP
ncbi:exodeoxyribonuclease V subunit alpha [Paucibacter sp. Y2R2-4]|uniref:exodeoxyribonuclease V subunit alpha n=1 Tax=Paucibacter sp. Y2R2-4 TaxID=2893553 RepID=UPI0021E43C1C|nr:exodeoxyribonuclease V subunit alpha [Paucibacter sp. Y2R2-4]MCV2350214.1 exodeoxyribonuclease V subunit alpha [Paucibacter sp. Y2R2-4]